MLIQIIQEGVTNKPKWLLFIFSQTRILKLKPESFKKLQYSPSHIYDFYWHFNNSTSQLQQIRFILFIIILHWKKATVSYPQLYFRSHIVALYF